MCQNRDTQNLQADFHGIAYGRHACMRDIYIHTHTPVSLTLCVGEEHVPRAPELHIQDSLAPAVLDDRYLGADCFTLVSI